MSFGMKKMKTRFFKDETGPKLSLKQLLFWAAFSCIKNEEAYGKYMEVWNRQIYCTECSEAAQPVGGVSNTITNKKNLIMRDTPLLIRVSCTNHEIDKTG